MSNSYLSSDILFVVTGMLLLISVAAETGVCVPLPSKLTSASAAIPAVKQWLLSRCLAMYYSITTLNVLQFDAKEENRFGIL
jgi:hypothetical protein